MIQRVILPLMIALSTIAFSTSAMGESAGKKNATDGTSIIMSYDDFANLTREEQKTYVKKLREMMVAIDERDPKFTALLFQGNDFLQKIFSMSVPAVEAKQKSSVTEKTSDKLNDTQNLAYAEYWLKEAADYKKSFTSLLNTNKDSEFEDARLAERYRGALANASMAAIHANEAKDPESQEHKDALLKKINAFIADTQSQEVNIVYHLPHDIQEASKKEFEKESTTFVTPSLAGKFQLGTDYSEFAAYAVPLKELKLQEAQQAKNAAKAKTTKPSTAIDGVATPKLVPGVVTVPPKSDGEKPEAKTEAVTECDDKGTPPPHGFRCMHSGFVISGSVCKAPAKLPMELANIDAETFSCDSGSVMCNPFVFGLESKDCDWKKPTAECWKNAKPFCVTSFRYSSKSCDEMSNKSQALESAVELILANKEAFKKFQSDFDGLCNKCMIDYDSYRKTKRSARSKAFVKADIHETCEIARTETEKILKRYGEKSAKPATTKSSEPAGDAKTTKGQK